MTIQVNDARFLTSAPDAAELPAPVFAEAAFAGKSNVGKSSLINALAGRRKLVRVSNTPGCTRGLNLFRLELSRPHSGEHASFDLVDLPGYGYARRSKQERTRWGPMIEGFLQRRAGLRVVVLILDIRRGLTDDDRQLLEFLAEIGREVLLVATKLDKLPRNRRAPALARLSREAGQPVVGFSAQSGEGRDHLWKALSAHCGLFETDASSAPAG